MSAPCTPARLGVAPAPVHLSWHRSSGAASRWTRRLGTVEREHSAWGAYLRSIYGNDVRLPFNLHALRWFWWWAPGAENVTRLEMPVWRVAQPGEAWVPGLRMERHLALAGFFVQHSSESGGDAATQPELRSDGLREVMRVSHPAGENPQSAFGPEAASHDQVWYWHAPGSGIMLSVGRSLVVSNRSALLARLAALLAPQPLPLAIKRVHVPPERGLRLCDGCDASVGEAWRDFDVIWTAPAAAAAAGMRVCDVVRRVGYDSVQLTRAFNAQRHEIIDCRRPASAVAGSTAAANAACPPAGSRPHLRRGGEGRAGEAASACSCESEAQSFLTCGACALPAPRVLRVAQPGREPTEVRSPRNV